MRGAVIRIVLAFALLLAAAPAWAAPKFPPLTGRVVDDAGILSSGTEAKLTTELEALEAKTGHQVVVATLPDLQGYEIEDYGYQLGRAWGIGGKDKDDGAILIVAPNQRKVRIEVGYGLEPVLTDALSSLILQRKVLPAFKAGDLEKGVVDGTEAIVELLGLPPDEARARALAAERQPGADAAGDGGSIWPLIVGLFMLFWIFGGALRAFGGRRGGGGLWWLLPLLLSNSNRRGGGWSGGGGWSSGGGGFSGGGGSFGGGGSSGSW